MSRPVSRREAVRRIAAASAGALVAPAAADAQTQPFVVAGSPSEVVITQISPATLRLSVLPIVNGAVAPVTDDGAVAGTSGPRWVTRRRGPFAPTTVGDLTVAVPVGPPAIIIRKTTGEPVQRLAFDAVERRMTFAPGAGQLFGLGEGGPQFNRKGHSYTNRNGQGGYQLRTHGGRVPIQWLVSTDGWGLFIHRPLGTIDLSGPQGSIAATDDESPFDLFVTSSSDPAKLIAEYARITGSAELPPLWSFGYMQSHRTLAGPDEIDWVARTFREKKLPCDALIYLGTEFTPSGWNTRNGEFGWKAENFPDPKRFIDQAHARHFKVVLHIVIEGKHMTGSVGEACTPAKAVPSGRTADDTWPDERPVACYWPYHKPLYDLGVDGMWPDQGDGLDAPSRLARIRMYWEGPQQYRPNERPFALHRNGSPGMQRYGAFLWSGDVYSTWETLKTHVPVAVNTGLSGIPFWGTDIGGFVPTGDYTGELHVRWFQFGAFCPSFRAHGRDWHLRLPWGWNTGRLGPAELRGYTNGAADPDPAELHNAAVEPIVRKYLELRYRLMPYTYTIARDVVDTGLPMIRALWLHHPDDANAVARGDQFLWGRDLLVSPVVEKGATSRTLYLPKGSWFDFWTDERLAGGRTIDRAVDLETMPLHVRAGAIVPMGPVKEYVDQVVDEPLTVKIYPGADGAFTLYEDDGKTFAHKQGEVMRIAMTWSDAARTFRAGLAPGSRMRPPLSRTISIRVAGENTERRIVFRGTAVEEKL